MKTEYAHLSGPAEGSAGKGPGIGLARLTDGNLVRKESSMLTFKRARSGQTKRQGCPAVGLSELRRQLAHPSDLNDGARQRLMQLARRLAAVQASGGEYAQVQFSAVAQEALSGPECWGDAVANTAGRA